MAGVCAMAGDDEHSISGGTTRAGDIDDAGERSLRRSDKSHWLPFSSDGGFCGSRNLLNKINMM
jgi:hypothetical protein